MYKSNFRSLTILFVVKKSKFFFLKRKDRRISQAFKMFALKIFCTNTAQGKDSIISIIKNLKHRTEIHQFVSAGQHPIQPLKSLKTGKTYSSGEILSTGALGGTGDDDEEREE